MLPAATDLAISTIYRAATGAVTWAAALARINADMGAGGMQLLGINPGNGALLFAHVSEGDAERAHLYVFGHHARDPRMLRVRASPLADWCYPGDDDAALMEEPDYRDNLAALGGRHAALLKLAEGRDEIVVVFLHARQDDRPFDAEQREALSRIGLHLREALPAYRRLKRVASEGALGASTIERTAHAMAIIDSDRRLAATNASFDEVLAQRRLFEVVSGVLQCPEAAIEKALTLAMMQTTAIPAGAVDRTRVVPLGTMRGDVFALSLTLLPPPPAMQAFASEAQVLLTAHQRPRLDQADTGRWQEAFRLSPAEAKVAAHIYAGLARKEIARALHVSPSTVKTQMESIFAKTETTRQAELVRVLSTLSR